MDLYILLQTDWKELIKGYVAELYALGMSNDMFPQPVIMMYCSQRIINLPITFHHAFISLTESLV